MPAIRTTIMETKTTSWTRISSLCVRLRMWEGRSMEEGLVIHGEEEWWKMAGEGQGFFGYINGPASFFGC